MREITTNEACLQIILPPIILPFSHGHSTLFTDKAGPTDCPVFISLSLILSSSFCLPFFCPHLSAIQDFGSRAALRPLSLTDYISPSFALTRAHCCLPPSLHH